MGFEVGRSVQSGISVNQFGQLLGVGVDRTGQTDQVGQPRIAWSKENDPPLEREISDFSFWRFLYDLVIQPKKEGEGDVSRTSGSTSLFNDWFSLDRLYRGYGDFGI